jgi:WD40 repeat protein/serine/threonine protein kinase/tetratricopeptide (TPR) repeat protein
VTAKSSSGARDYGRFDELAEEFAQRYRRGERPSLEDYVDRLPEMADEIREMFRALVEVERVEGEARDDAHQPPPSKVRLREIGDYRIVREVRRGGMGVVYEAEQISLGRRVALKVLPGHVVGDPKALERFRREAKAAARLHHTNIVPVFEVGREGDVAFYAMQFIQGQGLDQVIDELGRLRRRGGKPAGDDWSVHHKAADAGKETASATPASLPNWKLRQVAESLLSGRLGTEAPRSTAGAGRAATEAAETDAFDREANTHAGARDMGQPLPESPSGADVSTSAVLPGGTVVSMVESSGRRQPFFRSVAQIGRQTAQGLAYAHSRGIVHRDIKPSNLLLDTAGVVWITDFGLAKADDDGLTATGDILGTLRYMAPERFRGQGDARADIYALGLTLYEFLTLRPAYESSDRLKLIERVKNEEPARPRSIDGRIPRDLETIVLKAIEKEPGSRYQTADAIAEDLRRFLADEPIKARQVSTTERYWRWARRNPMIATLGGVLTAILVMVTIGSLLTAARFSTLADVARNSETAERGARIEADQTRKVAEKARVAAQAEAYRAMLSEVKALRAGHQPGWRDRALDNLARLAVMPTSRRDLAELRTEAAASVGEFGVREVARFIVSGWAALTIDFSPDSRTLLTATGDGNLDLWDVTGPRHLRRHNGVASLNTGPYARGGLARFLPDCDLAFLDSRDGVAFLDSSGKKSTRPPIPRGKAKAVRLSSDRQGRWLAVGSSDGRIDLYDAAAGARQRSFDWRGASDFLLSPDRRWLALQRPGSSVEVLPTSGQGPAFTLPLRGGYVAALAFSPDGAKLAGVDDRAVAIWDLASKQELLRLTGHKETVTSIAFSPDGSLVATTCGDAMTRIWDAHDGRPLTSLPGPAYMQAIAFSPDGTYLAAAANNGQAHLYQLEGRREHRRLIGHQFGVHRLVFHPSLPRLASSSDDHNVMVWDANSAHTLGRWVAHQSWVTGLAISPNGLLIASTNGTGGTEDPSVRLWDAESGILNKKLPGNTVGVFTLAFDPTGRRIASGDIAGTVLLFEVKTGRILRREALGGSGVSSLVFLNEGRSLLVGQHHGGVSLFELDQFGPPRSVSLPDGCTRLVVDRRGERAILGDSQGSLIALSLPDLTAVLRIDKGHEGAITSLALSPDGLLLATAGIDRRVVLRDPVTFKALLTLPPWTGPLQDVAFDAAGRWIAFAGADSEIGLWDLALLRDELAAVGLAWDQSAPRAVSTESLASEQERPTIPVPVIRPGNIDPAEFEKAQSLLNSGVAAFRQGRYAAAATQLQQASERFQTWRRSLPTDAIPARQLGMSHGFLASALRDLKRPAEALAHSRESLAVLESMNAPQAIDLYNMACGCAMVSALDDQNSPGDREQLQARAMEYLGRAIKGNQATYRAMISEDHDLDPLRARADFRQLLADAGFPRDPFAPPSPLSRTVPETRGAPDPSTALARKNEGRALVAAGLTRDALPLLASALAMDPSDTLLLLDVAALQAWFGKDADFAVTCRRALEFARDTKDPTTADRTAKICCLLASNDKAHLDAALALARQAVTLGKGHEYLHHFQMALGMAEYRSGRFTAADEALLAAAEASKDHAQVSATSAFYHAMSLYKQGKEAEAHRIATAAASRMRPLPADENNPLTGDSTHNDLILWLAYKEAKALLDLDPAPASASQPNGQ